MATEGSPSTILLGAKLSTYPLSRLFFITIKDNRDKWKIGKVNDWIRKCSKCYYIVKGTKDGTHFHAVVGMEPNAKIKPQKGIHLNVSTLENDSTTFIFPSVTEREDERKAIYYRRTTFERLTQYVIFIFISVIIVSGFIKIL